MYAINRVLYTVPQGALTQLYAGTADGEFEGGEVRLFVLYLYKSREVYGLQSDAF